VKKKRPGAWSEHESETRVSVSFELPHCHAVETVNALAAG